MMQDGLGSVRGVVDNNVGVLWNGSPAPYGEYFDETGTSQTNYGFTGEQTDGIGLVYLRNRYMSPALGQFISLDPLETANRYAYVGGNPINRVDPSGLVPTESDVSSGRAEFSCNCGWLDWNHIANSNSRAFTLFDDIQYVIDNGQSGEWWAIHFGIQLGFEVGPISLEQNLFDDYAAMRSEAVTQDRKLHIATNIFMSGNESFEQKQAILAGELAQAALTPPYILGEILVAAYVGVEKLYSSVYAEEDLVSDLLGFHVAYQRHENPGTTSEDAYEEIKRLCRTVNTTSDRSNSLAVFRETYANGANLMTDWQHWRPRFIPLTGCNAGLCSERSWPSPFQAITSLQTQDDNERGWVWYSRFSDAPSLQSVGVAVRPNVFRIGD